MLRRIALALLLLAASASLAAAPDDGTKEKITVTDGKVTAINGTPLLRAWIGLSPLDLSPELQKLYGAPTGCGVLVQGLLKGGPAARDGVHVGDVVIAIGGWPVDDVASVADALRGRVGGQTVTVDLLRDKQPLTLLVTLAKRELPSLADSLSPWDPYYVDGRPYVDHHSVDRSAELLAAIARLDKLHKLLVEREKELAKDGITVKGKK